MLENSQENLEGIQFMWKIISKQLSSLKTFHYVTTCEQFVRDRTYNQTGYGLQFLA